jgi:hypothetical protein
MHVSFRADKTTNDTSKGKPLDRVDVWPSISENKPSPRAGMVYNVERYRANLHGRLSGGRAYSRAQLAIYTAFMLLPAFRH